MPDPSCPPTWGHAYRIAPDPREPDLQPPLAVGDILGPEALTLDELTRRRHHGVRFVEIPVRGNNSVQLAGAKSCC
ncbi:MAG: hypothetical protein WBP81_17045 [Solirubrobacteraceae bacterium]